MIPAVLAWRQHPTAIEAELDARDHDIFEWHRGTMSSRRLLVLLRHPIEDGPYQRALRDGDWPPLVQLVKELHKEVALGRASRYVGTADEYQPTLYMSPLEAATQVAEAEADDEFAREATDEFEQAAFG